MYGTYNPYEEYMASIAPDDFAPAAPVRRYSRAKAALASAPAASGPSALDYGSLGLGIAGTVLGGYGTYLASEQADRQHRDAMEAYRDEMARENRHDARAEDQRQVGNALAFGNYARDLEDDVYGTYSPWARKQGL